jgi:hypothetical protein
MRSGVLLAVLLFAAFSVPGATSAAGSASFVDTAGDAGLAPDLTSVIVANDELGLITFRLTVTNRSTLGLDDLIVIPIATDDPNIEAGTRADDGASFILGIDSQGAFLTEWNGQEMAEVKPQPASLTGSFSGGVATVAVKQEDLAPGFPDMSVPIELGFYVLGLAFNGDALVGRDDAPDGEMPWNYRITETLRLIVTNFGAAATVKPGQRLAVQMGVARGDTGAAVSSGKLTCRARLGGKVLRGSGRFVVVSVRAGGREISSPRATCSWSVPRKQSKGKAIRGSVSVTASGITVTRAFSTRVR